LNLETATEIKCSIFDTPLFGSLVFVHWFVVMK
jgi:hypothetical protein